MHTQKFLSIGGRIIRKRAGKRVITIAYRPTDDGKIQYGATIFKKESPTEQWSKKEQREIALGRFERLPVFVPAVPFEHVGELDQYVRECLFTYGCQDIPF